MTGKYFIPEQIEKSDPDVYKEWSEWLNENFDPGHYESWKDKEGTTKPYENGKPQWVCETYMPGHLCAKLKAATR